MFLRLLLSRRSDRQGDVGDRGKGRVLVFPAMAGKAEPRPGLLQRVRRSAPGLVTGAADVDPALVLAATVAGAVHGYSLIWVVLLSVPFLLSVFSVAGRIGHQTRRGLVDLLRTNYGQALALLCAACIVGVNMGMLIADIMAVSDAFSIITGQRRMFFVSAVGFLIWYILIFRDYQRITKALVWFSLPVFTYVIAAIVASPSPAVIAAEMVPRANNQVSYLTSLVAILGSLLTPDIIVWQTSSRSEQAAAGLKLHRSEHLIGSFVTTILSISVMITAAAALHPTTVADLTTREAANALAPLFGDFGPVLYAIGIIGAGMVALPIIVASLCYSISEAMGWKTGLSENPWEAKSFYVLISAAVLIACVANFFRINPVIALFWSQVLAGAVTAPILVFILLVANDRRIMPTVNSRAQNFWIGAAAGGIAVAGLLLVFLSL